MEEGPFRMPRPADRGSSRPAARHNDETPAPEEPQPVHRAAASHRPTKETKDKGGRSRKPLILSVIAAIIILLGIGSWLVYSHFASDSAPGIDSGKFQAVFFTNGQVYFGKLQPVNSGYLKLTDIFYLQAKSASGNPQQTTSDQSNVLIKLGNEIHGPQDEMIIDKSQVLFYENLKPDGKVAQTISSYKP